MKSICRRVFSSRSLRQNCGTLTDSRIPELFQIFDIAATDLLKVGETPAWGGSALTYMTSVTTKGLYYASAPGSSKYGEEAFGNQFSPTSPSIEGQDDAKGKRLWDLSSKLVGL